MLDMFPSWLWQGLVLTAIGAVVSGDSGSGDGSSGSLGPNQVPPTPTPATPQQVYQAMQAAWPNVIGGTPSRDSLLVLLSQWDVETGGGKSMIQWNIGNFKADPNGSHLWCEYMTTEVVKGVTEHLMQSFAAYTSLADGMQAYLRAMHTRFSKAWSYVVDGDLDGFAQALKDQGYYTQVESIYQAALQSRYNNLNKEIA
jgi:hypothetical protein